MLASCIGLAIGVANDLWMAAGIVDRGKPRSDVQVHLMYVNAIFGGNVVAFILKKGARIHASIKIIPASAFSFNLSK